MHSSQQPQQQHHHPGAQVVARIKNHTHTPNASNVHAKLDDPGSRVGRSVNIFKYRWPFILLAWRPLDRRRAHSSDGIKREREERTKGERGPNPPGRLFISMIAFQHSNGFDHIMSTTTPPPLQPSVYLNSIAPQTPRSNLWLSSSCWYLRSLNPALARFAAPKTYTHQVTS
jgi:hypothetical protein